ncbi:protein ariadne-2 [Phtheirospermum japonicum]|uniref:RBR-type E3 ubiquitin transferase n=1 Tax=Phtheirospermum japonicum TaxID=374723 RepID=A0A830D4P7_9LAMI|nr:protein ariadne-2 [Phtheirospermum japonicum]
MEEENIELDSEDNLDEHAVKMYFKGVSAAGPGDSPGSRISGVGVVMEKSGDDCPLRVQKRLDFYVDELVADYLALLDGLSVAIQNDIRRVYAFTDSESLHNQITNDEVIIENPLLLALRERIKEQSTNIETFVLKLVTTIDLQKALHLAQIAVGIIISSPPPDDDSSTETCSICCEEKLSSMMLTVKCSHRFCSHCMKTYVEGKVQSAQVPIKCPHLNCKYRVSASECISFLPVASYESFERAMDVLGSSNRIYCPYPSCSVLLDAYECSFDCVECHGCGGFVCVECEVPWHASMTCDEYRDLALEEREDGSGLASGRNKRWRRCQQCRSMIELVHGCYHMTCM